MSLSIRKRGKNFTVRGSVLRPDGVRVFIKENSTGCAREREALKFAEVLSEKIKQGLKPSTFADAVIGYINAGKPKRFLSPLVEVFGDMPLSEMTRSLVDEKAQLHMPHVKPATWRRQWHGPILAVMNHHADQRPVRPPDGSARTYFFTPEQADAFIKAVSRSRYSSSNPAMLAEFLFGTGARVREALLLDRKDVYLDYGYVVLRNTKNGSERTTLLPDRLIQVLGQAPTSGKIFLNAKGKPYVIGDNRGVRFTWWNRALSEIELDPSSLTPHIARHSWATWRYSISPDTVKLMTEGGWSKLELVSRYVKLATHTHPRRCKSLGWDWEKQG